MRSEEEIVKRLRNYEKNISSIKDTQRINILKQWIIELSWVLSEESNNKFNTERR